MSRSRIRIQTAAAGVLLLTLTAAAAACDSSSSSAGAAGKPVTITYWTSSAQSEINWLDSHFNATHSGIKVHGQYIASADNTTTKVGAALKTGTEPNVLLGEDPENLPFLAESGKVVDLTSALKTETSQLYPGIRSALSYQGKQLGMALGGVGNYVLFYNKSDFAKAGISSPPATWTQLESDAIKLSDPAKHRYGIYIPWGTDEWISYDWEGLLWADGGQFMNSANTKVAFDSPAGVQALTTWVNLVRKDHAAPTTSFAQAGSFDGAPAFAGNTVAMIVEGQWAVSEFDTAKVKYGVAVLPAGTSGHSGANIGIGVATVFKQGSSAAQNAAVTFVKWLGAPAQGAYLTATSGGLPSAPAQLNEPAVKKEIATEPTYQTFATQLETGHTRPSIPAYAQISLDLATEIQAALNGTVTPAQALAKAAAEGNQAIASDGSGS
jgi:ABC-type glycerol-3-phosphate transport system substrate-binding protein